MPLEDEKIGSGHTYQTAVIGNLDRRPERSSVGILADHALLEKERLARRPGLSQKDREMGIDTMAAYGHLLAAYSESAKTQAE